jgi:uncharacterized surface protein with fasciclin (FAS1) repeats
MLSWKLILCAALLAVTATAQKPDVVIDDGAVLVDEAAANDYAPAPEGDYATDYAAAPTAGDYDVDYAAAAPATGDYAEDYTYAAAPGTGDYDYVAEAAAAPTVAPVVKPTAAAPAAAPTAPKPLTIGALVASVCPGIGDILAGPNFTTLVSLLERDEIANTVINPPKGVVVIAAPTNAAFEPVIKAVGAAAIANNTIIGEILANHIAVAANASASTATALSGETLSFWTMMNGIVGGNPAPTPASIAGLAATSKDGVITDNGGVPEAGKVVGAASCGATGPFAFAVDQVLLPTKYAIKPTVAAPAPAPSSAGFKASAAFAAVAGAVALVM